MKQGAFALAGVAAFITLALAGCDLEQAESKLHFGNGHNLVAHDNALNEGQLEALRERVAYQSWPPAEGFGMNTAGIYYAGTNVRPPGVPEADVPPAGSGKP